MTARSLHVGLNGVDPGHYDGWDGALDGAENDARAMSELATAAGFEPRTLLTAEATAGAVLGTLASLAADATPGDTVLLSYAGHGDQLTDLDGDETDSRDETWLLHDREILDDEIAAAVAGFPAGVDVVLVTDSCHSGTIARRRLYADLVGNSGVLTERYARSVRRSRPRDAARDAAPSPRTRTPPATVARALQERHADLYRRIRRATPRSEEIAPACAVVALSACQDNQEALEIDGRGVFTGALLEVWDEGGFTGSHRDLTNRITARLPGTQSPNLTVLGPGGPALAEARAFAPGGTDRPDPVPGPASVGGVAGVSVVVEARAGVVRIEITPS